MHDYAIVTGRIPNDDEDTMYVFRLDGDQDPVALFKERMRNRGGAREVYINWVARFRSDATPQLECYFRGEATTAP